MEYRQGKKFDERTADMVDALEAAFGSFRIVQGSYSEGGNSAGTHTGGGAIDVSDTGMGKTQINRFVRTAREQGWAMWWRPPRAGVWASHFHGIAIQPGGKDDRGVLSASAHSQVIDYYEGRDGLAGNGPDPHAWMGVAPTTFEQYMDSIITPKPDPEPVPDAGTITGGDIMLVEKAIGGVTQSWWLTLYGKTMPLTNDQAKTYSGGPRIKILNTPNWNDWVRAFPIAGRV